MDDAPEHTPDPYRKPARPRLSLTPSWVMLGFALGAAFVYLLPSGAPPAAPAAAPEPRKPAPAAPQRPARLTEIEAVFEIWGQYAIWDGDRTEVALWNSERDAYADFYEVRREGGVLYFRTIPRLTRPMLAHGTRSDSPLVFTETEEMRQKWLEARSQLVPARAVSTPTTTTPAVPKPRSRPPLNVLPSPSPSPSP
jgi:hypothetical protein